MTTATKQKSGIKIMVKDVSRFSDKISRVADACSNSSSIPILTCMKIEVKAGSVVFTGGDGIRTICIGEKDIVEADENTAIAVPASLFSQIINKLPSGAVEMTLREKTLLIKAGTAKFELQVLDVEEYPAIFFGGSGVTNFTIPASQLTDAFRSTMYACSTNQTMQVLQGVCIQSHEGQNELKFTATDRNRLSRFQIDEFAANPFKASVSAVSCKEIIRFFEGIETDLKVAVTESALSVTGPGTMFFTKLLDGEFPETDKLIPKSYEVEVTFERDKLLGALTRATVFAKNKKMAIFNFKDNELSITSRAEVGQVVDSLPCQTLGKEMRIGIDVFYLIEALKTFREKEVRLGFMSPVQPVLILPVGEVKSLGLVIPIRITE